MRYGLTQSVGPAVEPVTLAEAKLHMRITTEYTVENDMIENIYIPAARQFCETATSRQFCTATWVMTMDEFPEVIWLPRPPVASVTHVKYIDINGDTQTFSSDNYDLDTSALKGRIVEAYGEVWPSTRSDINAVTVTYVAGYGVASAVPANLKSAVLMVVADMYEHRMLAHELRVTENETVARLLAAETVLEAA